jgi:hypothetical protein
MNKVLSTRFPQARREFVLAQIRSELPKIWLGATLPTAMVAAIATKVLAGDEESKAA